MMGIKLNDSKGKILVTYHKKYPLLKGNYFFPLHVGRAAPAVTKDGILRDEESNWLICNLPGDDTGDNISERNREYSECTGLYWFWKNYDFQKLDYVGVFSYRRQLILNDLFDRARNRDKKKVYKCVELMRITDICKTAEITEDRILELMKQYDYIVPLRSDLEKINIHSTYEDYSKNIPGVHITDLFILEDVFGRAYPDQAEKLRDYLYSPNKLMYQIFITKPPLFNDYCEWLFNLLFQIDPLVDSSRYSVNGRRTMGYLAEILFGFYFTNVVPQEKTLFTGVTFLR